MRIVLVNPNRYQGYSKPPLGLLSVATVCEEAGHSVWILDADLLNLTPPVIARCVEDMDLVGITAMTPLIGEAVKIAKAVRSNSKTPVILGGVHASIFPDDLARLGIFDTVIAGEGEDIISEVIGDLHHKVLKPVYKAPRAQEIPIPDYSLIDIAAYHPRRPHALRELWTSATTSRGCGYACTFCSKAVFGNKYRAMPSDIVVSMVEVLSKRHGVKDITFYDDEFTLNKKRVRAICELLISKCLDVQWTCEARVDLVDVELLRAMKQAGCRLIYYGIESGNQVVLSNLNKGITLEEVEHAVRITHSAGIEAAGYFMLGCPGETPETMLETIDFAAGLRLDHAQFSACSPLPGSRLYDEYVAAQNPDWSSFTYLSKTPKFLLTSERLTAQDIESAVERANSSWRRE